MGHRLYFPVALGIKLTTATVLLILVALAVAGVLLARGAAQGRGPLPAYLVRSSVPSIPSASGSRTWATLFSITSV